MRQSKYIKQLEPLLGMPFFTTKEAIQNGIPRHALAYFVQRGILERVYTGTYRSPHYIPKVDFEWEHLAQIAASISDGVICLISALCYYNLTDQIMREAWIAIPHHVFAPKRPGTRIVRMRNMEIGILEIPMGEFRVRIFDRERTIVDAFRYLSKEIAIKAIQRYMQGGEYKPEPKKLAQYAKVLRVDLTPYILSLTT